MDRTDFLIVGGGILFIAGLLGVLIHDDVEKFDFNLTVYKENMPLEVKVQGRTDNQFFHLHSYKRQVEEMVKTGITEFSCEEVINNPQKIVEKVKNRFNEAEATLDFLSIIVTPPTEFTEAGKSLKVANLILQKDSMISASAKHDAVGYTSEAERLEERRDKRFNAQEERKIKMREIESNERVKMRQAEAIENAADNLGMFSGDLAVEIH